MTCKSAPAFSFSTIKLYFRRITLKVGIGYCNQPDAHKSGIDAARKAIEKGGISHPDVAFAFVSGQLDANECLKGLQSVLGSGTPIIGGSAIGVITNDSLSYSGHPTAVLVMQSDRVQCSVTYANDLDKNEKQAGKKLAENLSQPQIGNALIILYDSVKIPPTQAQPPVMNASSPLIQGIEENLSASIPIFGAGLLSDYDFTLPIGQFSGTQAHTQSVVGALFSGDVQPYYRIMHGCSPLDGVYHKITRIEGPVIYEIDHQPIVEKIDALYGNQEWRHRHPVNLLTIGINHGDRFAEPKEHHYVNRLITGALPNGEGIAIFETDLEAGTDIQFMLRDSNQMIASARRNSLALIKQIQTDGKKPRLGIYIDCAGRAAGYSNTSIEEAAQVQQVLNQYETPLIGFYSGVEIAPFLQKSRGLDWTGVLLVLAE